MTIDSTHTDRTPAPNDQVVDWTDLGREMWSFLTGREAAINYRFIDMTVEVPRDTGADAPARHLEAQRHPPGHHPATTPAPTRPLVAQLTSWRMDLLVDADLQFSVDIPGLRTVTGALTGSRQDARADRQRPLRLRRALRRRRDPGARRRASPSQGVSVTVVAPAGPLVTLGAPRTSWLQRRITGSRHIRVERGAGLWSLARGRAQAPSGGALPTSELAPPATLWPIAPTFRPRPAAAGHHHP